MTESKEEKLGRAWHHRAGDLDRAGSAMKTTVTTDYEWVVGFISHGDFVEITTQNSAFPEFAEEQTMGMIDHDDLLNLIADLCVMETRMGEKPSGKASN